MTYYLYIIFAAATVVLTFLKLQGFEYYKIENSKFCFLEAILSNFKTTHDMIKQGLLDLDGRNSERTYQI